jgi:hypothetical protein
VQGAGPVTSRVGLRADSEMSLALLDVGGKRDLSVPGLRTSKCPGGRETQQGQDRNDTSVLAHDGPSSTPSSAEHHRPRNYSGTVLSFENGKLVEIRQDLKDN